MSDEERQDGEQTPEAGAPENGEPEVPSQQVPEDDDQAPTAEPPPEAAEDEEGAGETEAPAEPAAEGEGAAEAPAEPKKPEKTETAAEQRPKPSKKEAGEVVPGAELDPIAIEPERPLDAEERARREAEEEERRSREAELTAEQAEEAPLATKPAKLSGDAKYLATGKRKSSVARVIITPGKGAIEVNQRQLEEYFPRAYLQSVAKQPLVQSGYEGNVDVRVRVRGGGVSGQAAAVRHGIARALCDIDPELRRELKRRGMLTRDARVKERRKAGLKKARKRPQFSKR